MTLRLETAIFPRSRILVRIEQHAQGVAPEKVSAAWRERQLVEDIVELGLLRLDCRYYGNWIVGCRDSEQLSALKKYLVTYHARAYQITEERPFNPVTISESVTVEGRYVGHDRFGAVTLRFEPSAEDQLLSLEYVDGDEIPKPFRQCSALGVGILRGLLLGASEGREFGNPVVGLEVKLLRAGYHFLDTSSYTVEQATLLAFSEMLARANLVTPRANSV